MHKKAIRGRVLISLVLALAGAAFEVVAQGSSFVTRWNTDVTGDNVVTATKQIRLPLSANGTYDFVVSWGDGNENRITAHDQGEATHTYATKGEYEVTITGTCKGFGFSYDSHMSVGDSAKLLDVSQWGPVKLHNEGYQFAYCTNLSGFSAPDSPDLSNVTNMSGMFNEAASFNRDIGGWNVDRVIDYQYIFTNCPIDQDNKPMF